MILDQFLNEFKIFEIIIILFAVIFSQLAPLYDKGNMDETKSGYSAHVGGLIEKLMTQIANIFVVEEIHLNGKMAHGGFLMFERYRNV